MPLIKNRQASLSTPDHHPVAKYAIGYKDVFSFETLYMLLHEWLIDLGFTTREGDADFPEVMYLQRDNPQLGKEIWVRWRCTRDDGKLFRHYLDIDIHVLGLKDVEVLSQGKKVKANKGEVEVAVQAVVHADPNGDWEKHALLKHLKKLIIYRLLRGRFGATKAKLNANAFDLQAAVRTYLKLPLYKPEPEARMFWPKREPS